MRDTKYTNLPICPHCGHLERDFWEIDFGGGLDGDTVVGCGSCGKDYALSRHCSVSYSTSKIGSQP